MKYLHLNTNKTASYTWDKTHLTYHFNILLREFRITIRKTSVSKQAEVSKHIEIILRAQIMTKLTETIIIGIIIKHL